MVQMEEEHHHNHYYAHANEYTNYKIVSRGQGRGRGTSGMVLSGCEEGDSGAAQRVLHGGGGGGGGTSEE